MKALIYGAGICLLAAACSPSGKNVQVPDKTLEAFNRLHPNATEVKWIEEPGLFEAKFTDGKLKGAVSFDIYSEVIETEQVIDLSELPSRAEVEEYITEHYPKEVIQRAERVERKDSKPIYEIQITGKELVFSEAGEFYSEEPD